MPSPIARRVPENVRGTLLGQRAAGDEFGKEELEAVSNHLPSLGGEHELVGNDHQPQHTTDKETHTMSFNRIQVLGNLTRHPDLRYTPQGTPVCTLNLASNDRARDPKTKEYVDTPTFFRGTVWGQRAETVAQHFEKGSEIYLEGKLRPEEWTDREGKTRVTLGIQVSDFNFTGGSNRNRAAGARSSADAESVSSEAPSDETDDDEIDFS